MLEESKEVTNNLNIENTTHEKTIERKNSFKRKKSFIDKSLDFKNRLSKNISNNNEMIKSNNQRKIGLIQSFLNGVFPYIRV